uniref:NR LBD domain-containing protein n=1 Tax=Panagrolaimus sp. PS1159 TaxID=55785 RepID=A0AC35GUS7_9BILA
MFTHSHGLQSDIFHRIVEPIKRIQMTKEEYIVLKTIIFCSSKSESISLKGREILENEFQKYSNILLKHLQAKYGDAPGAVRYSQILSVMEAMTYFTQKAKEFYFYVGASFPQHSGHELTNSKLIKQIIY